MDPIGGGLPLLLDAFRFHRLRREAAVRLLFLFALAAALLPVLLPMGKGVEGFLSWFYGDLLDAASSGSATATMTPAAAVAEFTSRLSTLFAEFDLLDGLWAAASVLSPAVLALLATVYSSLLVDDLRERKDGKPVVRVFRALPRLIPLYVLLQIPLALGMTVLLGSLRLSVMSKTLMALLSSAYTVGLALVIPGLVLMLAACLAPLRIAEGGRRLGEALLDSMSMTRRFKMRIAFLDLTVLMAMNLPSSLLQWPFAAGDTTGLATGSIGAFFTALTWMMLGRLHGRLYVLLAAPADVVLPSAKPE